MEKQGATQAVSEAAGVCVEVCVESKSRIKEEVCF